DQGVGKRPRSPFVDRAALARAVGAPVPGAAELGADRVVGAVHGVAGSRSAGAQGARLSRVDVGRSGIDRRGGGFGRGRRRFGCLAGFGAAVDARGGRRRFGCRTFAGFRRGPVRRIRHGPIPFGCVGRRVERRGFAYRGGVQGGGTASGEANKGE